MEVDPIIDNTKPVIHSITVVPDPMLRGKAATVTAIVTDNLTGVKEVTATLDGNTITLTKDGNKYTGTYYTTTTWDIEAYTVTIVAEDVAGNITTDDTSVSLFQMYYFNVSNQSREIEKDTSTVFTIDGNFRDDEGNVPTDMNEILITSNIVQANVVQFDENGFFRINTFKIAKGNYFIDLNYNTDDYNYTTRLTITVSNPSTGSGGRGGAPSPTCTFTYSDWSTCNNGTQSREVLSSLPNGCMKRIEPVLTQECTLTTNPDTTGPTIPEIVEDGTDEPTGEILPTEELTGENDQPASPATGLFGLGDVGGFPLAGLGLLALILLIGGLFIFFKGRK
jgi:hypothetical protein